MIGFRQTDPRFPFLWEDASQPPGRWHGEGEGPVHYVADTPDGAWAEFLRHEEITDPADVAEIRRSMWMVELGEPRLAEPELPARTLRGGLGTYARCRREARRLRALGVQAITAPSAALRPGGAHGWRVDAGVRPAEGRDGRVFVLFGPRPDLIGWAAAAEARPSAELLDRVHHLS